MTPDPHTPSRLAALDLFRGSAVALMLVYHFCFDLNYFGVVDIRLQSDPFWLTLRSIIVGGFVLAVGASLALSTRERIHWGRFARRQAILGAAAGLVSLGTYLIFPFTWVVFGVLHFIFVARILALFFLGRKQHTLLLAAVVCLLMGLAVEHPAFNHPWLHWLGMMTRKPLTEDYVPLLPWFGILLLGLCLGQNQARLRGLNARVKGKAPEVLVLTWLGRHSLIIYLLHQPLFMGLLYLLLR